MRTSDIPGLLKETASEWMEDKATRLAAALAYYTIFSLAPLLVIAIGVAGLVFGHDAAGKQVIGQVQSAMGEQAGKAVGDMVNSASQPGSGVVGTILGILMLLFGAAGLFGQLQDALNTIWEVQPKPGQGIWGFIRQRFLSFTMVLGVAFLLLVSLMISAALAAIMSLFGDWQAGFMGGIVNEAVSFVVITLLFAMIFKYLPDAKVAWSDVWLGAAMTALLFEIGKFLIALYVGHTGVASAYGAAGSLAVILVWVYYSSAIFLFGAEFTKVYSDKYGSRIVPAENAEPVTEEARAQQGIPHANGRGGQPAPQRAPSQAP